VKKQPIVYPFETEIYGVKYSATYTIDGDVMTVTHEFGTGRALLENQTLGYETLAMVLLWEILYDKANSS
jgi:hypothetical protein